MYSKNDSRFGLQEQTKMNPFAIDFYYFWIHVKVGNFFLLWIRRQSFVLLILQIIQFQKYNHDLVVLLFLYVLFLKQYFICGLETSRFTEKVFFVSSQTIQVMCFLSKRVVVLIEGWLVSTITLTVKLLLFTSNILVLQQREFQLLLVGDLEFLKTLAK